MRMLYILGWGYVAVSGLLLYQATRPEPLDALPEPLPYAGPVGMPREYIQPITAPATWWELVRKHCNPVEVTVTLAQHPPGHDLGDQALAAACYALAGKIDKATEIIEALPADQRAHAASIVFNEGHPVADMGDDEAAGPIMELVLRYTPDNYMALYHAGIAQYRTKQPELARKNLIRFLELYRANDGWTSSAKETLRSLGGQDAP
jgi:tetratricopeptide (TPR) repeat protein